MADKLSPCEDILDICSVRRTNSFDVLYKCWYTDPKQFWSNDWSETPDSDPGFVPRRNDKRSMAGVVKRCWRETTRNKQLTRTPPYQHCLSHSTVPDSWAPGSWYGFNTQSTRRSFAWLLNMSFSNLMLLCFACLPSTVQMNVTSDATAKSSSKKFYPLISVERKTLGDQIPF